MVTFITKNKNTILDSLQIFLFFLLGFNFFNLNLYISIALFVFIFIRLFFKNKISGFKDIFKKELVDIAVLATFIVSFVLFKTIFDGKSMIFKNVFHFLFLIILFWVSSRSFETDLGYKGLSSVIGYFAGCFLYISISCGITFAEFGLKSNVRLYIDVWTREYFSSTIASLYLIPIFILSLSMFGILIRKKHYLLSATFLIPIIISTYISIRLANRGFFLAAIIAIFIFCYLIYFQYNSLRKDDKENKYFFLLYIPLILSFLALIFVLFVRFNVFGIADAMKNIPFLDRIISGGTDKVRSEIYKSFFRNGWRYPFGGLKQSGSLEHGEYVHNAFLDMYACAGIIPLICFMFFIVRFVTVILVKRRYKNDSILFFVITSLLLALVSISLFEPIFNANGYYFASYFALFSFVSRDYPFVIDKKKKKLVNGDGDAKNESASTN